MVYMIGSDLETQAGLATGDLFEMMDADLGENINLVIMTGGTLEWQNDFVSDDTCQLWQIKDNEMVLLQDNMGLLNMATPQTLSLFIDSVTDMFSADRNSIIFWDHGGGTFGGFGKDENYPDSLLHLDSIDDALTQSGVKFDFVGFDACLMGSAELALMLERHADYFIASQENIPDYGWYYTDWLTELGSNPGMSTVDLGILIIDDYVEVTSDIFYDPEATLSLIELRQMPYTYMMLSEYFSNATIDIQNNEYREFSLARTNSKNFADGYYEQIDAVGFIENTDVEGSEEAIAAINSAVKYYSNSFDVEGAHGLSIYFPYEHLDYYSQTLDIMREVGYTDEYTYFFDTFVSAMTGGQSQWNEYNDITPEDDFTEEEWYDPQTAETYEDEYEISVFEDLIIDEKNDGYVLSLTDEQWDEINTIELQVFLDDGEGYIDMGLDNIYEFDEDGDLLVEFDYTWVSIDGQNVAFYAEDEYYSDDGYWYSYGRVPALLNGDTFIEIMVYWDDENPTGYVAGYREYTETAAPVGKGLFDLQPGDTVEWLFDYYDYDGNFDDSYIIGDTFVVPYDDIYVSYEYVGDYDALIYFILTDIFNNVYETEAVWYSDY